MIKMKRPICGSSGLRLYYYYTAIATATIAFSCYSSIPVTSAAYQPASFVTNNNEVMQRCRHRHPNNTRLTYATTTTTTTTSPPFVTTRRRTTDTTLYNNSDNNKDGRGRARFSVTTTEGDGSATASLDGVLRFVSSDAGGVVLGSLGLLFCLWNKLAHLDYLDNGGVADAAAARADLLAVFGTLAVFLNGVSKLDVTSALAESVTLEGVRLSGAIVLSHDGDVAWALESLLDATPADTAVLLTSDGAGQRWAPVAYAGVVPASEARRRSIPEATATPILDRFFTRTSRKESYLPTLQALPGKTEFTYLPPNAQEALLLPVRLPSDEGNDDGATRTAVLVLGSDTPKSFTPRDIAWCQVVAARMRGFLVTTEE